MDLNFSDNIHQFIDLCIHLSLPAYFYVNNIMKYGQFYLSLWISEK